MSEHEMSTTTTTTTSSSSAEEHENVIEQAITGLFDVGRLWAAHGLTIGRSALETSALTLKKSAELLGELSERFEPRRSE